MAVEEQVALSAETTFRIGGPARYFMRARSIEDVREALHFARSRRLAVFVLGGGSNVLFDDQGYDGLVLRIGSSKIELAANKEGIELIAAAGEPFDHVVQRAVDEGLWGLENLSGIPGSVGGAIVQNIGAYGAAVSEHVTWVDVLDRKSGEASRIWPRDCGFGYRQSIFKHPEKIVLRAGFLLSKTAAPNLTYGDLRLALQGIRPSLEEIRRAVLAVRRAKFPDLAREGTAGSFFKNPIVSEEGAARLSTDAPLFFLPEVRAYKVALAYLLDHGLHVKGMRRGGARLFERQPLVIAADRGASSADVKELAREVARRVFDAYRIRIEPEVEIVARREAPAARTTSAHSPL